MDVSINKYLLKDFYGDDYLLTPYTYQYQNNGSLAILLFDEQEELFCDMTVNISTASTSGSNCAFVDTNNNPWIIEYIEANELGKPTGRYASSGYCQYPEYEFDLSKMNEGQPNS